MYSLVIEGNAFLWHQIRCIMGVLLLIGEGKEESIIINELLDIKTNERYEFCAIFTLYSIINIIYLNILSVLLV